MRLLMLAMVLMAAPSFADEGMWLFNEFPSVEVKARHGFGPDQAWLDRVRLGSLRLGNGCSASFVSATGLVMTNHHCVRSCLEELSSGERDVLAEGFIAGKREEEARCTKLEVSQLVAITDVTEAITAATKGVDGAERQKRLNAEQAKLESACANGETAKRCDVIALWQGARHHLYAYRRLQDVRLVFAPEFQMAAFGGDPDNFSFPRYAFDLALLRVYVDGAAAATPEHLKWAKKAPKEGQLVFVSGHPGSTERLLTVSQLTMARDVVLPFTLLGLSERRGRLEEWLRGQPALKAVGQSKLRSIENSLKASRGAHQALASSAFFARLVEAEARLREKAPEHTTPAWGAVSQAMDASRGLMVEHRLKERAEAFQSELFGHARALVRFRAESGKPNAERLPEMTDAKLPALKQSLASTAKIHPGLETATLGWSLSRLRELLGADDVFVKKVLGRDTPEEVAARLVQGTTLADPAARLGLLDAKAFDASKDPMLAFAKLVDGDSRAVRAQMESTVDSVVSKNAELLADARRAVWGTSGAPDATSSLRLSYGQLKGVGSGPWSTKVSGLFERATGKPPYALSERWLAAKGKLPKDLPYNLSTTNDVIGGNSGSPLVDAEGSVVGLIFDGNLGSLGGRYGYDGSVNRSVAVSGELMPVVLEKVYGVPALAKELTQR